MRRILFTLTAAVSAVLSVAVAWLWVRSYGTWDAVSRRQVRPHADGTVDVVDEACSTRRGRLGYSRWVWHYAAVDYYDPHGRGWVAPSRTASVRWRVSHGPAEQDPPARTLAISPSRSSLSPYARSDDTDSDTFSSRSRAIAVFTSGVAELIADAYADQRFNQMITDRVLGNVLLGINEQVNCNDCVSAFGSAGSFSAGIHGRKNLTPNLSLLAGIAYAQYK